jgi:aconitate hydratase
MPRDAFDTLRPLTVGERTILHHSLPAAEAAGLRGVAQMPCSLKVLLENLLRHHDGESISDGTLQALVDGTPREIPVRPGRVLMQDLLAGPALADLAALRDAVADAGGDPAQVNPRIPVDLVIDHSLSVDAFASPDAARRNAELDYRRNRERYEFFRWCQNAMRGLRVIPPDSGIVHQVNLEYLAEVVCLREHDGALLAVPDTLVGIDSHTPMVNGLGVLGWGVGGIEAQAAMLGQPLSMLIPPVVGVELTGRLPEGATATDLVLTVTQRLRAHGVVGKFVEFHGAGLERLPLADRATISNMAPEYGATCVYFPIDAVTLDYLRFTGRAASSVALVEAYARAQGLWRDGAVTPRFSERLVIDLDTVEPCLAGPRRPQDRIPLAQVAESFERDLPALYDVRSPDPRAIPVQGMQHQLDDGDVVIAAITSCTNTSNPAVMLAAGLLARNAVARGLTRKPWVKSSFAPGSKVVKDYLDAAGLSDSLDALGFALVGFGCTTCGGFSGPLPGPVADAVRTGDLVGTAVLSGNRNFEGRIHPQVRAGYLASPPLVVAYAIAGSVRCNLVRDPLGLDLDGVPVYLRDIWPGDDEIQQALSAFVRPEMFRDRYADIFEGDERWAGIGAVNAPRFPWDPASTYLRRPPFFDAIAPAPGAVDAIRDARLLAQLGDSITTDHLSPSGAIDPDGAAGRWLQAHQVSPPEFNSYGARRGNHEVMVRGGFSNIRLRNLLAPGSEGGWTRHMPSGERMSIFDAACRYRDEQVPLMVVAGRDYGCGSSRDWAAKATALLGVKAVVAEGFERIHRANLVGVGVVPLQLADGITRAGLQLDGSERLDVEGLGDGLRPGDTLALRIRRDDGRDDTAPLICRLDTAIELAYYRHGGILPYVYRQLVAPTRTD